MQTSTDALLFTYCSLIKQTLPCSLQTTDNRLMQTNTHFLSGSINISSSATNLKWVICFCKIQQNPERHKKPLDFFQLQHSSPVSPSFFLRHFLRLGGWRAGRGWWGRRQRWRRGGRWRRRRNLFQPGGQHQHGALDYPSDSRHILHHDHHVVHGLLLLFVHTQRGQRRRSEQAGRRSGSARPHLCSAPQPSSPPPQDRYTCIPDPDALRELYIPLNWSCRHSSFFNFSKWVTLPVRGIYLRSQTYSEVINLAGE